MTKTLKWVMYWVLFLSLPPLSMVAQNKPNEEEEEEYVLDSATVIARWIMNDDAMYRMKFERYNVEDSITVDSFESSLLCTVKVADSSSTHYILEANVIDDPDDKDDKIDYSELENLHLLQGKQLMARIKTTDFGIAEEIENWDELKSTVKDIYAVAEKTIVNEYQKRLKLDAEKTKAFKERLNAVMASDEYIKNGLFGPIIELTRYHGRRYKLDTLFEYTDTTDHSLNVLGEVLDLRFPWQCQRYYSVDTNDIMLIEEIKNLDVEGYIEEFANKVEASKLPASKKDSREAIIEGMRKQNLSRQMAYKFYIHLESGWTIYSTEKDFFQKQNQTTIKIRTTEILSDEERAKVDK